MQWQLVDAGSTADELLDWTQQASRFAPAVGAPEAIEFGCEFALDAVRGAVASVNR